MFCLRSSAERNLVCLSPRNMACTKYLARSQVICFVILGKTELDLLRSESDLQLTDLRIQTDPRNSCEFGFSVFEGSVRGPERSPLYCEEI